MNSIIFLLATCFGAGMSPKAPGTVGSLVALPLAAAIHLILGMHALWAATAIAFFGGWWVTARYMRISGKIDDPKEVVIDEVAGQWLTLCLMPMLYMNLPPSYMMWLYAGAFAAFRLFDIVKPWPISVVDRKIHSGFGVMFDDILAALYAALLLGVLWHILSAMNLVMIELPSV